MTIVGWIWVGGMPVALILGAIWGEVERQDAIRTAAPGESEAARKAILEPAVAGICVAIFWPLIVAAALALAVLAVVAWVARRLVRLANA